MVSSRTLIPELKSMINFKDCEISSIEFDSREVKEGSIFFALKGLKEDGSIFIEEAVDRGAKIVLSEDAFPENPRVMQVSNLRSYLGIVSSRFYDNPSTKLHTFCVTGTNGKTSCVESLSRLIKGTKENCGYISTIGISYDGQEIVRESQLTTPDPVSLNKELFNINRSGSNFAAIEASSHGLKQKRISGLEIGTAIFTSFSHDHLDYHSSLEDYKNSKFSLFRDYNPETSIIQIDSDEGLEIFKELKLLERSVFSVSSSEGADFSYSCKRVEGLSLEISIKSDQSNFSFHLDTLSTALASNVVCSFAALLLKGFDLKDLLRSVEGLNMPDGRMDLIQIDEKNICCIDFAHTPEALQKSLNEIRDSFEGNIWCVFGCGGERDKAKRPMMGSIAEKFADYVILTNDNPRSESEEDIFNDIVSGIKNFSEIKVVKDRKLAVFESLDFMLNNNEKNIMLLAGKGHENYQTLGSNTIEMNDKAIVCNYLERQGERKV